MFYIDKNTLVKDHLGNMRVKRDATEIYTNPFLSNNDFS